MKKLLLFLSIFTLMSCERENLFLFENFTPELVYNGIAVEQGDTTYYSSYTGKELEIRINLNNTASKENSEIYNISVINREGVQSSMKFKNTDFEVAYKEVFGYESITADDFLTFVLKPLEEGEFTYDFEISNSVGKQVIKAKFSIVTPIYDIDLGELLDVDSLDLERPKSFDLRITDPLSKTKSSQKIKASYRFINGGGNFINAATNEEVTELTEGINKISVNTSSFGANDIELTITDSQGREQKEVIRLKSKKPEFAVIGKNIKSTIINGTDATIQVDIDNFIHPTNNSFNLTYAIIDVATRGEIADTTILSTRKVKANAISGIITDTLSVPIEKIGNQEIHVFGTDKFGSTKNDLVRVNAIDSELTISDAKELTGAVNTAIPFVIEVESSNGESSDIKKINIKFSSSQENAGVVKLKDDVITSIDIKVNTTNEFTYLPKVAGKSTLTAIVTSYIKEEIYEVRELVFPINTTLGAIELVETGIEEGAIHELNNPINFTHVLTEIGYTGDFKVQFNRIAGKGTLSTPTINDIAHATTIDIASGVNTNYTYLPTTAGKHELHFIITDSNLQTITHKITFVVTDSDIEVITTDRATPTKGKTSSWFLTFSKEHYQASNFNVVMSQTVGTGEFKFGSKTISANATFDVQKDIAFAFSYTPSSHGDHTITLNIQAQNSSTITPYIITFNVPVVLAGEVDLFGTAELQGYGLYNVGTAVTLSSTPAVGYSIASISTKNSTGELTQVVGAGEKSQVVEYKLEALDDLNFVTKTKINDYAIDVNANPIEGGTVTGGGIYPYNTAINISSTPARGWLFKGLFDGTHKLSDAALYNYTIPASDKSLVANFEKQKHQVSFISNNVAFGTVIGGGIYEYGATVNLVATATLNYRCTGIWEGDTQVSEDNTYTFTAGETPRSFRAVFGPVQHTVTITQSGDGDFTPLTGSVVNHGEDLLLMLVSHNKISTNFDGWYINNELISLDNAYRYKVTSTITIEARATLKQYSIGINNRYLTYKWGEQVNLSHGQDFPSDIPTNRFIKWLKNSEEFSTQRNISFLAQEQGTELLNGSLLAPKTEFVAEVAEIYISHVDASGYYVLAIGKPVSVHVHAKMRFPTQVNNGSLVQWLEHAYTIPAGKTSVRVSKRIGDLRCTFISTNITNP